MLGCHSVKFVAGKMKQQPFKSVGETRSKRKLQLIHSDVFVTLCQYSQLEEMHTVLCKQSTAKYKYFSVTSTLLLLLMISPGVV